MTTKEKIKHYIESKGISKNKFYTITGFSSSFLDSGNTIGTDKTKIIIEKFPDISMDWLILDKGPMLKESEGKTTTETTDPNEILKEYLKIMANNSETIKDQAKTIADLTEQLKSKGAAGKD